MDGPAAGRPNGLTPMSLAMSTAVNAHPAIGIADNALRAAPV